MTPWQPHRQAALRARCNRAGVVFHFGVWHSDDNADDHLAALSTLFAENLPCECTFNPAVARCVPLDNRYLQAPASLRPHHEYGKPVRPGSHAATLPENDPHNWYLRLYRAFNNPPYGLHGLSDADRLALWTDFCTQTGLLPQAHPQVFDWIRHEVYAGHRRQPVSHPLSNYFDDGLEWWGVWCLTVYSATSHTLAAIVASATD